MVNIMLLQQINEQTKDGATDKPVTGLHDAKIGDIIKIGVQGSRYKIYSKIYKTVGKDRLQDEEGNIFDRNGIIYRRKGWQLRNTKGKIVSAKHVTQKELDDEHDNDRRNFLKKYDWDRMDADKIEKILKVINVDMGTVQKRIKYSSQEK